MDPVGLF